MYAHTNVWNDCLYIIRDKGWELAVESRLDEPVEAPTFDEVTWVARKGEFVLFGNTPVELLGLVAVYEYIMPEQPSSYWWNILTALTSGRSFGTKRFRSRTTMTDPEHSPSAHLWSLEALAEGFCVSGVRQHPQGLLLTRRFPERTTLGKGGRGTSVESYVDCMYLM